MLRDFYNLILAIPKIRDQKLGMRGVRIFFGYARLRLKHRLMRLTGRKLTRETFLGCPIQFFDYEAFIYLVEEIFVHGIYRFIATSPQPVIFDCGSNIGVSVIYFKSLYPDARVVAFEPDEQVFALLKSNVESNGLRNVELHNVALSDSDGNITFHKQAPGSLCASILEERQGEGLISTVVRCRKLSDLMNLPIDFMKMDIEGAEFLCIPEVARTNRLAEVRELVIECHHNLGANKKILTTVLSTLETAGFSYQVSSLIRSVAHKGSSQDVMIYADNSRRAAHSL